MPKPMNIYLILLSILVVAGAVYFIFNYKTNKMSTNNQTSQILETRDFSCPGMTGFTFKYPVFKGWEVKETSLDGNECRITLYNKEYISSPSMEQHTGFIRIFANEANLSGEKFVTRDIPGVLVAPNPSPSKNAKTNRFGVKYDLYDDEVVFYISLPNGDFAIDIQPPMNAEKSGFSYDQFFQTVIESFKLIK